MIYGDTVRLGGVGYDRKGATTYEVVASAGEYDYSWDEVALLRRDGQLYFAASSGCSCYSFEDNVEPGDLEPVRNWQQAVEKAKGHTSDNHVTTFAERLAELRPAPSPGEPGGALPRAVQIAQGVIL